MIIDIRIKCTDKEATLLKKIIYAYKAQSESCEERFICDDFLELIEQAEEEATKKEQENG